MGPASTRTRSGAGTLLAAATALLLRRMRGDFERDHRLRPSTTALVYGAYAAQVAALAELVRRPTRRLPIAPGPARVLGGVLVVSGTGVLTAGAGKFGAGQLSGTEAGHLVDRGVYRWSRNPQYLGWLVILTGGALTGRSVDALAATAASALVFDRWIRREETNLARVFGDDYRRYRDASSRWLGAPAGAVRT